MARPSAADLPRPRPAVSATVVRSVLSEMASTNVRTALACVTQGHRGAKERGGGGRGQQGQPTYALQTLDGHSYTGAPDLVQCAGVAHEGANWLCVLQRLLQLCQLSVLGSHVFLWPRTMVSRARTMGGLSPKLAFAIGAPRALRTPAPYGQRRRDGFNVARRVGQREHVEFVVQHQAALTVGERKQEPFVEARDNVLVRFGAVAVVNVLV